LTAILCVLPLREGLHSRAPGEVRTAARGPRLTHNWSHGAGLPN